jgi:hypothetical protein
VTTPDVEPHTAYDQYARRSLLRHRDEFICVQNLPMTPKTSYLTCAHANKFFNVCGPSVQGLAFFLDVLMRRLYGLEVVGGRTGKAVGRRLIPPRHEFESVEPTKVWTAPAATPARYQPDA